MRALFFRLYQSGLCNQLLGLDVGLGLAHLTGRTLVPYAAQVPSNPVTRDERFRRVGPPHGGGRPFDVPHHHAGRVEARFDGTLLDYFDLPAPVAEVGAFLERHGAPETLVDLVPRRADGHMHWLFEAAWSDADEEGPAPEGWSDFAREVPLRLGPSRRHADAPAVRVEAEALVNAARFFHLRPPALASLQRTLRRVEPKFPYRDFAAWLVERLSPFNAVHIRRTDFKRFLQGGTSALSPHDLAAQLRSLFPRHETLAVCTDESDDDAFFEPLRAAFGDTVFLDHYILHDRDAFERFRALPRSDGLALAVVTLLVASEASRFAGTMCSTFTGWIHRRRLVTGRDAVQHWAYNEYPHAPFEDGRLLDVRPGRWSWNRADPELGKPGLQWFREWPEAVDVF